MTDGWMDDGQRRYVMDRKPQRFRSVTQAFEIVSKVRSNSQQRSVIFSIDTGNDNLLGVFLACAESFPNTTLFGPDFADDSSLSPSLSRKQTPLNAQNRAGGIL